MRNADKSVAVPEWTDGAAAIDAMMPVSGGVSGRITAGRQFAERPYRARMRVAAERFDKMPAGRDTLRRWQVNRTASLKNVDIAAEDSRVRVLVIETDEEFVIASDTLALVTAAKQA